MKILFGGSVKRRIPTNLCASALLLWAVSSAGAGTLGYVAGSGMGTSQYRQAGQVSSCNYNTGVSNSCSYTDTSGFLPYNSSDNQTWTSVIASYAASFSSSVDTNGLHANASITITNDPLDPGAPSHYWGSDPGDGSAFAYWVDTLTISGPSAAYMLFDFGLDGTLNATSHARADAGVTWSAYDSTSHLNSNGQWTFSTLSAYGPPIPSSPIQANALYVSPGDTISITLRLQAYAAVGCQALSGPMLCSASATSDVGNTLKFTSISFQDGGGNNLSGFSIGSLDNFNYNPLISGASSPVPEPGTAAGVLLGLAAVLRFSRKRFIASRVK
jgi:hypothetical protein